MKWFRIVVLGVFFYGTINKQLYLSSTQQKNKDERVAILQNYLTSKKSPLAKSAATFIMVSDAFKLDWRLLPAISGVESGFETNGNVHDFNAFGYMCQNNPCVFSSYQESIVQVAKTISTGYAYTKYRQSNSIFDLAQVYNQSNPNDWSTKIQYFMDKLK